MRNGDQATKAVNKIEWVLPTSIQIATPLQPRSDHKINNSPSIVPWLCAVSNNDWFCRSNSVLGSSFGRTVETEIIDTVQGQKSGHGSLVDGCSYWVEVGFGRVGCSIRDCMLDLSDRTRQERGGDLQVAVTWAFADEASASRGRKNMIVVVK